MQVERAHQLLLLPQRDDAGPGGEPTAHGLAPTRRRTRPGAGALHRRAYPNACFRHFTAATAGPVLQAPSQTLIGAPRFARPHTQAVMVCCSRCQVLLCFPMSFFYFTFPLQQENLACTPCVSLVRSSFERGSDSAQARRGARELSMQNAGHLPSIRAYDQPLRNACASM